MRIFAYSRLRPVVCRENEELPGERILSLPDLSKNAEMWGEKYNEGLKLSTTPFEFQQVATFHIAGSVEFFLWRMRTACFSAWLNETGQSRSTDTFKLIVDLPNTEVKAVLGPVVCKELWSDFLSNEAAAVLYAKSELTKQQGLATAQEWLDLYHSWKQCLSVARQEGIIIIY